GEAAHQDHIGVQRSLMVLTRPRSSNLHHLCLGVYAYRGILAITAVSAGMQEMRAGRPGSRVCSPDLIQFLVPALIEVSLRRSDGGLECWERGWGAKGRQGM